MDKVKLENDIDDLKMLNATISEAWRKELPLSDTLIDRIFKTLENIVTSYQGVIDDLKPIEEAYSEVKNKDNLTRSDVYNCLSKWREHPVHKNATLLIDYYKDKLKTLR
jgi:hypothetical protein